MKKSITARLWCLVVALMFVIPAFPAEVTYQNVVYTTSTRETTASAARFTGTGECVIPASFTLDGKTYTVNAVKLSESPGMTSLKVLPNINTISVSGCNALVRLEVAAGSSSAYPTVSVSGCVIPELTVAGTGANLTLYNGTQINQLTFDGEYAALYGQVSERYPDPVKPERVFITENVKQLVGNGYTPFFAETVEFENDGKSLQYAAGAVFQGVYVPRFAVFDGCSESVLTGAKFGYLDVSVNLGLTLVMESVETLFVGDEVSRYEILSGYKCLPKNIVGASLKTVVTPMRTVYLGRNLAYDLDGDGTMSIMNRGYSNFSSTTFSVIEPDKFSLTVRDYAVPRDPGSSYISDGLYGFVNFDNSGDAVFLNDRNNAFRLKADGTADRIDLPLVGFAVDADADGLQDFYYYDGNGSHYMNYRQPDGSYVTSGLQLTTNKDDIYNSTYYFDPSNFTVPSLEDGWMIGNRRTSQFETINASADLSKNGIPDLIDTNVGGVLYNIGDNKYYASPERGVITECDLNGDGNLDYVLFDETDDSVYLMLYEGNGGYSQKLLMTNGNISKVYCHDFDGDGDIDILLPFNWSKSSGYSFLVFYRNDGGNVFKKKEYGFDKSYMFVDCRDVDADGKYEVIFIEQEGFFNYSNTGNLAMMKCNSDFTLSDPTVIEEGIYAWLGSSRDSDKYQYMAGDIDNDGITECYVKNGSGVVVTVLGSVANTAPKKMAAPTAYFDSETGKVRISWTQGEDAETSACDLTYELRIGSAPGKADILGSTSLPDGRRRSLDEGNAGRNLSKLFNPASISEGAYYISVQAVDAGGLGGQWSDEFVYNHQPVKAEFTMNFKEMSTADTLELVAKPIAGTDYKWSVDGGRIVEQEDNIAKAVFDKAGTYSVKLTAGQLVSDVKPVDVLIAKVTSVRNTYSTWWSADFNSDGNADMIQNSGVYSNDGNGNMTKVAKTYNTDLNGYIGGIIDFNRNGYPDFIMGGIAKGNVFLNTGEGDFDFEYETKAFSIDGKTGVYPNRDLWGDFNNDGFPECYGKATVLFNSGDNLNFSEQNKVKTDDGIYYSFKWFADVNRDGFMDIVLDGWAPMNNRVYTTYNVLLKDSTATHSYSDPIPLFRHEFEYITDMLTCFVADLNSDGYLDLVRRLRGENFLRVIKGVPQAQWPATEEVVIPLVGDYEFTVSNSDNVILRDYDNNGYPDILLNVEDSSAPYGSEKEYGILLMQPDFKAELYRSNVPFSALPFISLKEGGYPVMNAGSYVVEGRSVNEAPERPAAVMARQTKDGLQISWSDAADDATPAAQMRYNVSVRKKGKTGDGSFLISPMNALSDKATPLSNYIYWQSTSMIVPVSVLEAGQTYEVQVQAIDMWNANSPMTEPVEVTVSADGYIDVVEKTAVEREVTLKYVGTQASSFSYGLDGGTLVSDKGNGEITAKWTSPGVKNITLLADGATVTTAVTVVDLIDVGFELPDHILAGAPLEVAVPEALLDPAVEGGFRSSDDGVVIKFGKGDKAAVMEFAETGTYEVESYVADAIAGNSEKRTATVSEEMPDARISKVDIDEASNCYAVNWDALSLPSSISKVIVSKETDRTDVFEPIDTVAASAGTYVDMSSKPDVVSARYRLNLIAGNGQTSYPGVAHCPLHVMINRAAAGGYNLMWNAYEGLDIDNYTILRGPSADALTELTRIAGSLRNYTDLTVPEGEYYYAVQFTPSASSAAMRVSARASGAVRSNAVCTRDAISTVDVASISILSLESEMALTSTQGVLHLFTEVLPREATFNRVLWEVVEGTGLAVIDQKGVLAATGNGNGDVTVRATALDGSGISAEVTISCIDAGGAVGEIIDDNVGGWNLSVISNRASEGVTVSGWQQPVTLYVVSSEGKVIDIVRTAQSSVSFGDSRYVPGVYFIKAVTADSSRTARFIKK